MSDVMPVIIEILLDNTQRARGEYCYPCGESARMKTQRGNTHGD